MSAALTDAEYDRLDDILSRFRSQRAMNLETLDGFFAALICCPDTVPPSEYLAEIWGGEMADEDAFATEQDLQDFLDLVMRHWNAVVHTLHSGDVFLPLLLEDEHGVAHANDWAQGFMRGWRYAARIGSNCSMTKSMAVRWCRFWRWRMNTTPILKCVRTTPRSMQNGGSD